MVTTRLPGRQRKTDRIVKIFICEHACSTRPAVANLAATARFRGDILLQALLSDLAVVGDLEISILRDPAYDAVELHQNVRVLPLPASSPVTAVEACIQAADAVWPLAPESNGLLEAISEKVLKHKKILLGSSPDAIHLAGSKYRTSQALHTAGIPVVTSWRPHASLPAELRALVVKPDDGAGCSDTHIFSHQQAAREWIANQPCNDYVLQPYIAGRPCNLSLLCGHDAVLLLGCNEQRVAVSDNQFHYLGSTVNSIGDDNGDLLQLARRVIAAIPGLWGYVGIDLVITSAGPVVLGVNPRMTLPHTGLRASLDTNPAAMLFDLLHSGHCNLPQAKTNRQISIDINASQPRSRTPTLLHQ